MVNLSNFKPADSTTVKPNRPPPPEHSIGLNPNTSLIQIKVDSGKFMDTVFTYTDTEYDETTKQINYSCWIDNLIISGIHLNTEQMTVEQAKEFQDTVSTPVFEHMIQNIVAMKVESEQCQ